jgi:hypothetical protein
LGWATVGLNPIRLHHQKQNSYSFILHQVSSTCWFGDDGLHACVAWGVAPTDVFSTFARSRCKQWVVFAIFKVLLSSWHLAVNDGALALHGLPFGKKKTLSTPPDQVKAKHTRTQRVTNPTRQPESHH